MTDLEIDKALAIAIGYREHDHVFCPAGMCLVYTGNPHDKVLAGRHWVYKHRVFSHKDWNVAGPIGERYDCYPMLMSEGWWSVVDSNRTAVEDTPQKAIALAVIGAKK